MSREGRELDPAPHAGVLPSIPQEAIPQGQTLQVGRRQRETEIRLVLTLSMVLQPQNRHAGRRARTPLVRRDGGNPGAVAWFIRWRWEGGGLHTFGVSSCLGNYVDYHKQGV